jgi:DMSO/TMAO reductase YedYZ molybdopterin-dependent catalytic subunit
MSNHTHHTHDPLQPHRHDPNPEPPAADAAFQLHLPNQQTKVITPADLAQLPQVQIPNCYIVSTGHGTSGPFTFGGVTLLTLIEHHLAANTPWTDVAVISADGFGNRVLAAELYQPDPAGSILLSTTMNGLPLTRQQGLVRLIVPNEKDDALRQVKWIGEIIITNNG